MVSVRDDHVGLGLLHSVPPRHVYLLDASDVLLELLGVNWTLPHCCLGASSLEWRPLDLLLLFLDEITLEDERRLLGCLVHWVLSTVEARLPVR